MKKKPDRMNEILRILFLVTAFGFLCTGSSQARSITDERRREFFHEEIPQEQGREKSLFQILSVSKGVITGYAYDSGPGTRQVRCIDLKFKIHRPGQIRIPYLYIYLYDSEKKLVQRLERVFLKEITGSQVIDPTHHPFKGKKTYILQFDYPNETLFKYYLAVVGNDKKISVDVKPGSTSWTDFEFEEKKKIQNQH